MTFPIMAQCHLKLKKGIVFALNYGLGIMRDMEIEMRTIRAGDANMFLSPLFGEAFATVTGANLELYNTDGSQGAARGAGIGAGIYKNYKDAFIGLKATRVIKPDTNLTSAYQEAYEKWVGVLKMELSEKKKKN